MILVGLALRWGEYSTTASCSGVALVSRLVPAPRVTTNPDELDVLSEGSVVLDQSGDAWQKSPTGNWVCGHLSKPGRDVRTRRGPVAVLWEPGACPTTTT